jgi:hypothetical protein
MLKEDKGAAVLARAYCRCRVIERLLVPWRISCRDLSAALVFAAIAQGTIGMIQVLVRNRCLSCEELCCSACKVASFLQVLTQHDD